MTHLYVPPSSDSVAHSSTINLVNLLMRNTDRRVTVLQVGGKVDPDPEVYVVTRVDWRDKDLNKPILPQLPRVLSMLETLRGSRGVPKEIHLDSTDGVVCYIPTGIRMSQLPSSAKASVQFIMSVVNQTVSHFDSTRSEVEDWFWRTARKRGFNPEIVERIARREKHYDSPSHEHRFSKVIEDYFSLRFKVYRAESCLKLEGAY